MNQPDRFSDHYAVVDASGQFLTGFSGVQHRAVTRALSQKFKGPQTWAQAREKGWQVVRFVFAEVVEQEDTCKHSNGPGWGPCGECVSKRECPSCGWSMPQEDSST